MFDKTKSGLLPYDLHIHDLDVIISLFGKPQSFTCNMVQRDTTGYPEDLKVQYIYPKWNVTAEAACFMQGFLLRRGGGSVLRMRWLRMKAAA